jgi:signal transduction histidine kinase
MRERVSLHGGVVHAGVQPNGGYAVRASLPLSEPPLS